jgi:hypothetical protein
LLVELGGGHELRPTFKRLLIVKYAVVALCVAAIVLSGCGRDSARVGSTVVSSSTTTPDTTAPALGSTTSSFAGQTPVQTAVIPFDHGPLQGRFGHSVVWTGSEVIIWGGHTTDLSHPIDDGAAFNPDTGQWRLIASPPLNGMTWHFGAWSGSEMLVVGSSGAAAYDPTNDSWRVLPPLPLEIPHPNERFASRTEYAWSGSHIYVWNPISDELARLDPSADDWEAMEGPGLDVDPAKVLALGDRLLAFGTRWSGGRGGPSTYELLGVEYVGGGWRDLPPIDFRTDEYANVADPGTATFVGDSVLIWGDPSPKPGSARLLRPDGTWDTAPAPPIDNNILHPIPIPLADGRVLALSEGGNAAIWEPTINDWTPLGPMPGILGAREAAWAGHEVIAWSKAESWRWVPPPPPGFGLPAPVGLSEIWHHSSDAIGRYSIAADDFLVSDGRVAVLGGNDAQSLTVLNIDSGRELWQMDFPEHPGTILGFTGDRLMWATYERVGVRSGNGESLWEHHFDDARWPTLSAVNDDRAVVALDPTMEGDDRPPLIVQFDEAGHLLWATELSGSNVDEDLQWVDLLVVDDGVIIQTTDALYRLDWNTGSQVWRSPFAEADIETFGLAGGAHSEGVVYVADPASEFSGQDGGEILGVDAVTGQVELALTVGRGPRVVGVVGGWLVYTDEAGVHGVNTESRDSWHVEMTGAQAAVKDGRVYAVSPNFIAVLTPTGDQESGVATSAGQPQLPPALLGQTLIVPGWEGTKAIDISTGQIVSEWPGSFYSPVIELDWGRALIGVAGDGIRLVRSS